MNSNVLNFLTWITDCDSHSPALLDLFLSSGARICSTMAFPPLGNSANVFVFGDFNVHHKDWLTHSGGTDRPGELCYNFSIPNDLT